MTAPAALVTGASRGIGALIAEKLATAGWDLTVSARSAGPLQERAAALAGHGGTVRAVTADMGSEEEVLALADAHVEAFGRVDALVLNAGMGSIGAIADFPARRFDKLYAVNVRSAFVLVQRLLPTLRTSAAGERGTAKVIAVSSLTGVAGEPLNSAYGASKAALTSLCETLNTEESEGGVTATAVCPGYVATDMTAPLADQVAPEAMIDAADVAELVVALTRLGRSVVVPSIPMTRPGPHLWRA
ncbi:SDR family NAD(P)-dependent oxidoreductase [Pseudonocardia pini]|uniref:SDR family NAD(P)-dependent oxidoreductase n=1 Tax=Pseudonocardia pini TaxID=2758030 RepID=UPI0015F0B82D|nr:SDR family oxidoreductase [Pseudonocardia pini]